MSESRFRFASEMECDERNSRAEDSIVVNAKRWNWFLRWVCKRGERDGDFLISALWKFEMRIDSDSAMLILRSWSSREFQGRLCCLCEM